MKNIFNLFKTLDEKSMFFELDTDKIYTNEELINILKTKAKDVRLETGNKMVVKILENLIHQFDKEIERINNKLLEINKALINVKLVEIDEDDQNAED